MRTTMIPSIEMTFRDAVDRCLDLIGQQNSTPTDTEEGEARADAIAAQWLGLADKLLGAVPVTPADGAAIADLLLDECAGLPNAGVHGAKLAAFSRLRDLLVRQVEQREGGAVLPETSNSTSNIGAMDEVFAELQSAALKPLAPDSLFEAAAQHAGITIEQARACYDVFTTPLARIA